MTFYGYKKLIHFQEMVATDFWAKNVSFLGFTGKVPLSLIVFVEFFWSLFLILALFTKLALISLLNYIKYLIAVVVNFFMVGSGYLGFEMNNAFVYFMIDLALFFTGLGKYSLDY